MIVTRLEDLQDTDRDADYLIGSNAAHVALHTPCSVLVVR